MVGKAEWKPQVDLLKCVIYPNVYFLIAREYLNHISINDSYTSYF